MGTYFCIFLSIVSFVSGQFFGPQPGDNDCALILPSAQRNICITYSSVSGAFSAALGRQGPLVHQGPNENLDEKAAELGQVLEETSRILAHQFSLSRDSVSQGLPLIDTTKTLINNYCPDAFRVPQCRAERYRSVSGVCNNLDRPLWGKAGSTHTRILPPNFGDGVSSPRLSITGKPLPSPRLISRAVHNDNGHHDHAVTLFLVFWGQFMDHDITLTSETKDSGTGKTPKCCDGDPHANCLPIDVSPDDTFYGNYGQRCLNFVRSPNGLRQNCALGPRTSFNVLSSFLDGNTVYSNSEDTQQQLRSFKGGQLKVLPVFDAFGLKPLLPLKLEKPNEGCIRPGEDVYCFFAGEPRVNENTALCAIHTLMVRSHNALARKLSEVNPHWPDETLFQEARRINIALMQHITYNEFLPMVLGREHMQRHGLVLQKSGHFGGYDANVDAGASSVFAQAAFRFGHTLLPSSVERWSSRHRVVASRPLHEMLQQPYDLYKPGWVDTLVMGLSNQVAQAYDKALSREVTDHLFQEPGKDFGLDLASLNLQRGREHGVPSYNRWREWCGLAAFGSWHHMAGVLLDNHTVDGFRTHYASPEDVDLWSAGVSEAPLPGSMVGPTFGCILARQFHDLRIGDRFWYENGGWPSSFTLEQLHEIRKIKLSRIVCDNTDDLTDIQVYVMVLPDHEINPRVPCKSGILPHLDMTRWRDAAFP